jgi:hypothetical protein
MKKFKFFAMILGLSFGLTAMGVNAWTYKPYGILFENWGTQTIYTAYEDKETGTAQRWETLEVSNGGNPEVVLQGDSLGTVDDNGFRVYLWNGQAYEWKTQLSKLVDEDYRLKFKKNGWTIGMINVTGFWWKY